MSAQDHGKASTYDTYGCRCEDCTSAHAARVAAQRARRKARGVMGEHGSVSTYTNYGCRCEDCRNAMRHYQRVQSLRETADA